MLVIEVIGVVGVLHFKYAIQYEYSWHQKERENGPCRKSRHRAHFGYKTHGAGGF